MPENFWKYNEYIDKIDVKWDQIPDWFNENQIKNKARNYVEKRISEWISTEDYQKLLQDIKTLLERQDVERINLTEELEKQVIQETREELDKEALIQEAKTILYEKLWINENQAKNSRTENFLKWIVDVLVIDNYDLAIEIYETNWKVIIDALKALMSWEWIKQMAEAIWESFMSLFTWNAYEKWKAVWELWLVTTWIWVTAVVWKKAVKVWMSEITKLRANKERLVSSSEVKTVITDTNRKIDDIVPKKEVDFDKMLVEDIAKLWDKDRIDAASFYLKWKKFTPEQEKAIIIAHEIWKDRPWAWIYNYNQIEISQKSRILKEAWFSVDERRLLMDKWVCGKDYKNTLVDNLPEEQIRQLNKLKDRLEQIQKLESIWVPKEYSTLLLDSWFYTWKDLFKRYENLNKINGIDFQWHIDKIIEKYKWRQLSKKEAYLIFGYTDFIYYSNMNKAIRDHHLPKTDPNFKALNPKQIDFINRLEVALWKVDDVKWELKVQYRWDNWEWWLNWNKKWILRAFTSSSNPTTQPYWESSKVQVTIKVLNEWKAKDLTDIAMIPNFGNKLRGKDWKVIWRTEQETVILPNFKYRVKEWPKEQVWKSGYWEISIEER